jgi:hypothetical protein
MTEKEKTELVWSKKIEAFNKIMETINETPNDMDLGKKLRAYCLEVNDEVKG